MEFGGCSLIFFFSLDINAISCQLDVDFCNN
ncbi:hypothetical protein GLYMA_05G010450v4 [Glycine max]|nr:hypothetical protein GLYMA_05G010450v4 [Glycine max]KAH1132242.1 hypothetical protein GYH30_011218 [Glycine max]